MSENFDRNYWGVRINLNPSRPSQKTGIVRHRESQIAISDTLLKMAWEKFGVSSGAFLAPLQPSELCHRLYLSEDEAVRFTGLGKGILRKYAKASKMGPRQSLVYKRAELEKL